MIPQRPLLLLLLLPLLGGALARESLLRLEPPRPDQPGQRWSLKNTRGRDVLEGVACTAGGACATRMVTAGACLHVQTEDSDPDATEVMDCVSLGNAHWFGGPEQWLQLWPVEKLRVDNVAYVPVGSNNMAVAERYFLSSSGVYMVVDAEVPLFLDINALQNNSLCLIARNAPPYRQRETLALGYSVCGLDANDAKEAHLDAVESFLGKPTALPNERTVRHPIWSTWARYKAGISQQLVLDFAAEILAAGFNNSALEIDDLWETCYGSLQFDPSDAKFPDVRALSTRLHELGFRVTLWVHPFINQDCQPHFDDALAAGDLIANDAGDVVGSWWNGAGASVDFTKPAAAARWSDRLRALQQDALIDSFKCDAGEVTYSPQVAVLNGTAEEQPSILTQRYVAECAQFGDYIEVRSAAQTQSHAIFLRMLDKDSRWGYDNGLRTLVTTLLQMNMVGYPLVLPDMIGGNGYGELPTKELFIRWLQANTFMPALQFSYVPWDFDQETVELSLRFVELHASATDRIMELAARAMSDGTPINPPIWWIDPHDPIAQEIDDEFLLGDDLLVAPVLDAGATSRDVYLPRGLWRDENTQAQITGPVWMLDYSAPLDTLPYFTLLATPPAAV